MRRALIAIASLSLGCPPVPHVDTDTTCDGCAPVIATVTNAKPAAPGTLVIDAGAPTLTSRAVPFPSAKGTAFLDYIAWEPSPSRVWIPVGSTGSVDVYDVASGSFTAVGGFKTEEREGKNGKRTMGPSAVTIASDGFAYVGNRATNEVCPIELKTLKPSACIKLASQTDGVVYVASAKEVWVTTPKDSSLTVLDASKPGSLKPKAIIKTEGEPEGYAVDEAHGVFFTNLEDKGGTLAIDVKTRKVTSTWSAGCASDGPRGVAFSPSRNFVIVACTDHVQVLDAGHGGALLGKLDTGAGVDNLDLAGDLLYVAAAKAGKLTIAKLDDKGQLAVVATGVTSEGARNAVSDASGNVYVGDSLGSRLLVLAK